MKGNYNFPFDFPEVTKDIVEKLLQLDPSDRLGAGREGSENSLKKLMDHPFFLRDDGESCFDSGVLDLEDTSLTASLLEQKKK